MNVLQARSPAPAAWLLAVGRPSRALALAGVLAVIRPSGADAQELVRLPPDAANAAASETDQVVVVGRANDILGVATSSSEGVVSVWVILRALRTAADAVTFW